MASVIKIKRSTTPGSTPGSLVAGEIAVNIPDRKLFVGDGSTIYTIGDQYLAVANAAATYQTIATERAALANTNIYIATKTDTSTFNSALANTNTYIASKVNSTNPATSGLFAHTGRATISTNLAVSGNTSIAGNLVLDGDLTVEGAITYISSSTLNVDDSMIKLAANNAADTVDVGFYGKYVSTGTKYSGLFRDASDGVFKFYTDSQSEPSTTVDTGATGYAVATIEAVIDGGTY